MVPEGYLSGAWRCRNSAHVAAVAKLAASSSVAVADFAPNSATDGVWPTNGFSLSRDNIRGVEFSTSSLGRRWWGGRWNEGKPVAGWALGNRTAEVPAIVADLRNVASP